MPIFKQMINNLKAVNREYVLLFLIFIVMGFLMYSSLAISQAPPEQITLTTFYPFPYGEFNELRARRMEDFDNPAGFYVDPNGESRMHKIRLVNNGGQYGDLTMENGGKIYGTAAEGFYIDMNWDSVPVNLTQAQAAVYPAGIYVNSVRTKSFLFMGAIDPYQKNPPLTGKHVYDVSEGMPAKDCEAGDVVLISANEDKMLVKSHKRFDTAIAGVISENPKLYLGALPGRTPLALAGVVNCKVTAENGPIKRGDLLVSSSLAGHAMRADPDDVKPGMLIGKALESLDADKGKVLILVNKQ